MLLCSQSQRKPNRKNRCHAPARSNAPARFTLCVGHHELIRFDGKSAAFILTTETGLRVMRGVTIVVMLPFLSQCYARRLSISSRRLGDASY
jgi:hypothetical protein